MNILILSCGTGGGHNAAAYAVEEEAQRRGWNVTLMNPYGLCAQGVAQRVDSAYISIAQASPRGFGALYAIGNAYRRLPWRSPVYFANSRAAEALAGYLQEHPTDAIVMTHLYPAEMLTYLKNHGVALPKTIFVATDYTCIPFTEECALDAYVIPSPMLTAEFAGRGIPEEKIYPFGIPVRSAFRQEISKEEAKRQLGLDADKRYLLVSGGSIGAGNLEKAIQLLLEVTQGQNFRLTVICGSNASARRQLLKRFGDRADFLGSTQRMAGYLRACDLYFTKPGGLSTTEAAVAEVPLALLPPIPGCESRNLRFYVDTSMAVPAVLRRGELENALALLDNPAQLAHMRQSQRQHIPKDAAAHICALSALLTAQ